MPNTTRGLGLFTAENIAAVPRAIPESDGTYRDVARKPESTEAMGPGVDTRDDGYRKMPRQGANSFPQTIGPLTDSIPASTISDHRFNIHRIRKFIPAVNPPRQTS